MANIKIAFINASTVINDSQAQAVMQALQTQVSRDFAPVWGVDAGLEFFKHNQAIPGECWWLVLLDNSDQAGALGYHDITHEGLPLGKIFAKSDLQYGSEWSVTASHELLEMLEDPDINLTVFRQKSNESGILYAYEVCDACEADSDGYKIDDVLVSDFVYPSWFEDFKHPRGTPYDHMKKIKKPFLLLPGGYIGIFKVDSGEGWTQLYAEGAHLEYKMRAKVGTRRERRRIPRDQWLASDVRKTMNKTKTGSKSN